MDASTSSTNRRGICPVGRFRWRNRSAPEWLNAENCKISVPLDNATEDIHTVYKSPRLNSVQKLDGADDLYFLFIYVIQTVTRPLCGGVG